VEGNSFPHRQPQLDRRAVRARKKPTIVQILRPLFKTTITVLFLIFFTKLKPTIVQILRPFVETTVVVLISKRRKIEAKGDNVDSFGK
jgi:hypothetical protein